MTNRWRHCEISDKTEEINPWAEVVIFYKLTVWSWKSATEYFFKLKIMGTISLNSDYRKDKLSLLEQIDNSKLIYVFIMGFWESFG